MVEKWNPEALYFSTLNGTRTAYVIFDLPDASEIPVFAEPFFMELNAEIELAPVMNGDDLQRGLSSLTLTWRCGSPLCRVSPPAGPGGRGQRPGARLPARCNAGPMALVRVTGNSGSGKSTVSSLLQDRGHQAFDSDCDGYCHWFDRTTEEPVENPPDPVPAGWLDSFGFGTSTGPRSRHLLSSLPRHDRLYLRERRERG